MPRMILWPSHSELAQKDETLIYGNSVSVTDKGYLTDRIGF